MHRGSFFCTGLIFFAHGVIFFAQGSFFLHRGSFFCTGLIFFAHGVIFFAQGSFFLHTVSFFLHRAHFFCTRCHFFCTGLIFFAHGVIFFAQGSFFFAHHCTCGVDDFIAACIKHKVISFTEIVELCRIVVKNLKEELQKTPEGHISIKAQRYWELIKALLKSEWYCDSVYQYLKGKCLTDKFCLAIFEIDGDDNIVLLLDFENPNINEQILCICSLMISISKEIQPKMVEWLQSIEGVYSRIGMISNEIAETVNYFCQHGWEQIDEHQQILESLIHIGINEIQWRNANYEMHRVQGIVFLQTMFVNMIATENLKPYIYKIIEICINLLNEENIDQEERPKFLRPITVLILILLWYDSEITLDAIAKIGKEFMIFSMILTFVKKVKYSFEWKASIISLIKFMEKYKSPDWIPIFNLKVFESILYILAKRLQIYNYKLKLQEEYRENDQELDDFS